MTASYSNNNLRAATSRYLLQHKDDPVAWQQWEQGVLDYAREQGKPILLSIGYAACHWCRLMARDSFADAATAALMNRLFVNIKVDREERPDLDQVYQTAHQLLTGRPGGWPLTVFLCPRTHLPFLVGTYFQQHAAAGQIGFKDLLQKVADCYKAQDADFYSTIGRVENGYAALTESQQTLDAEAALSLIPVERASSEVLKSVDRQHGGFGGAPKFPLPSKLERLLLAATQGEWQGPAGELLRTSLQAMAAGAIRDPVGGGFFRYARDAAWQQPHFEQMLYDNAALLSLYAEAWSLLGDAELEATARGIARWALEDMRAPEGAFYASQSAGQVPEADAAAASYCWQVEELAALLEPAEYRLLAALYGLGAGSAGQPEALRQQLSWQAVLVEQGWQAAEAQVLFDGALHKLRHARGYRAQPVRDDKILTAWNALMIRGLASAARVFGDRHYLAAAQQTLDFLRRELWLNQCLYASWQDGELGLPGYLDDYVLLLDALLELLRVEWRDADYRFATLLAEALMNRFEDKEQGGFFYTAHDAESLVFRPKPFFDSVMPAGNGIAAKAFGRLGQLCGEPRYRDCARRTLLNGWASMLRQPAEHHNALLALTEYLRPPPLVLLKGGAEQESWRHYLQKHFGARILCYRVAGDSQHHSPEFFALDEGQALICVDDLEPSTYEDLPALSAQLAAVLQSAL